VRRNLNVQPTLTIGRDFRFALSSTATLSCTLQAAEESRVQAKDRNRP
jgi:hypothetical protein